MHATVGLCAHCTHARAIVSARGSTFWRCALSATNPHFPKYPPLPFLRCAGYTPADAEPIDPPSSREPPRHSG